MENTNKSSASKQVKILPYFSSTKDLPSPFKVNKRYGVYEKVQRYKMVVNSADLKEEGLYNPFTNEAFKKSYKIKK